MLRTGNWNEQGLNYPGKIDILLKECTRYNINIIAVTELHWQDQNSYQLDNWDIVYSSKLRENTIGLLVTRKVPVGIHSNEYVSDRLVIALFKCLSASITLIGCYVPHNRDDEKPSNLKNKYTFYNDLYGITAHAPKNNVLIVIGYLNDNVSQEKWKPTIDKRELGEINENGISMLPYGMANNLSPKRTPMKNIQKQKTALKHAQYANSEPSVVNHTIIKKRWKTSLNDINESGGAAIIRCDQELVVRAMNKNFDHNGGEKNEMRRCR